MTRSPHWCARPLPKVGGVRPLGILEQLYVELPSLGIKSPQ